ncbi:hypothetical protein ACIA47_00045 [Micromonospora sp. NPDC051227]|uniref:hypothetical protein n=1 Tax=Micromonospora sp. NPDC051227 TaxID=3364285 RepID=UPI0037B4C7F3
MIAWTLPSGRTRYASVQPPNPQSYPAGPDRSAQTGPDARLAAVADPWYAGGDTAHLLGGVLTLLWLGRLIGGAPPLAGTRWFWFWIGLLVSVARIMFGTTVVPG